MIKTRLISAVLLAGLHCTVASQSIDPVGATASKRFAPPAGFVRVEYPENSFQAYIRDLPLKKYGSPVMLYDGTQKNKTVHVSVFDIPLLKDNLLQCADMVMKIRAEYLYSVKKYEDISFNISNGMKVPFPKYAEGCRVIVTGDATAWENGYGYGYTRKNFDAWLRFIYAYAGTLSLSKELKPVSLAEIRIGDVYIYGGSPGHVVMVLDLAWNPANGQKIMLLGQGYMPSQDFHMVKSLNPLSPWYIVSDDILETPEWIFPRNSLRRF